jgi:hypothetical protein
MFDYGTERWLASKLLNEGKLCFLPLFVLTNAPLFLQPQNKSVHLVKLHSMTSILNRDQILTEFYKKYLAVFFPHEDQLDGLPVLLDALGKKDGFEGYCNLRVDVLYERARMVGGIVYEYYNKSGCGLIAYYCK